MTKHVIALVDDLFWKARLLETVKASGATIAFVSDPAVLAAKAQEQRPDLLLIDLALRKEPFEAVKRFLTENTSVKAFGYFEHMRVDLHQRGKEAGIGTLMARSTFTEKLPSLLQDERGH